MTMDELVEELNTLRANFNDDSLFAGISLAHSAMVAETVGATCAGFSEAASTAFQSAAARRKINGP